jgi:hypothetical protein
MRRIAFKILLASFTCLIGLGLAAAWSYFWNRPLSLCKIAGNPTRFDRQVLRVRGILYGSSGGVLLLKGIGCGVESDAWAEVSLEPQSEYQALADELRRLSSGDDFGRVEVVITGKLEDRHQSCFSARFALSATTVEQMTPVSVVNFLKSAGHIHLPFRHEFDKSRILRHRDKEGAVVVLALNRPYVLFLHVNAESLFMPSNFILLNIHKPPSVMRSA